MLLSGHFWSFARRLGRYPRLLIVAIVMAFVSAGSLGGGLLALQPVLGAILGDDGATLRSLASSEGGLLGLSPPTWVVDALPDERFDSVLWSVLFIGCLTLVGASANFLHGYLSATIVIRVIGDVRRAVYRRLLRVPLARVVQGSSMDMVSRTLSDSAYLSAGLTAVVSKALASVTKALGAFSAALIADWRITLATLIALPLLAVIVRRLAKTIRRASRGAMRSQAELLASAGQAMSALRTVKVHQGERVELSRFTASNRRLIADQLRTRLAKSLSGPLTEAVAILVLGVLALVAAKAIIDGVLGFDAFLVSLGGLAVAGNELKKLTGVVNEWQVAEAAATRLQEVLDLPSELEPERSARPRRGGLPRHHESIVFEDLTFAYPGTAHQAVQRVSARIRFGERVAFVGPNGCGKTTLLSLVPRLFEPTGGRVLIDGVDIAGVTLGSLRRQIGVVSQETVLFRATIAENIAYAQRASSAAVERAAELAGAAAFIAELEHGYDTPVGDQGLTLSGGQRQRIAIARAILRDPAILILDEATSMIDTESEARLNEALGTFAHGRTTLVVAHRLSTVLAADRIVVMSDGRVVDQGTHDELLARCGVYRSLAANQLQDA